MQFLFEAEPVRGVPLAMAPGITRIVAPNPSSMTYYGTNTYLIEDGDGGLSVLDPGPDDTAHLAAVVEAGAGRIARILVSHGHSDHYSGVASLQAQTGAPSFGWHDFGTPHFAPDNALHDGDMVGGLRALFTPGHATDHLCFEAADGVTFSADHVMGWASTVVNPPDGDMRTYCASLELLLHRPSRIYFSGHGPAIENPHQHVRNLLAHRLRRERAIGQIASRGPSTTAAIVARLYMVSDPILKLAAERNVLAHLLKFAAEGKARQDGEIWHWTSSLRH